MERRALQDGTVGWGRDRDAGDVRYLRPAEASNNSGEAPLRPANWDHMTRKARKNWILRRKRK